jgi:hypothetical protein
LLKSLPELIDRETGVREVLDILENIIVEAGDLNRKPESGAGAKGISPRSAGLNRHVVRDARALQERRERIHPDSAP